MIKSKILKQFESTYIRKQMQLCKKSMGKVSEKLKESQTSITVFFKNFFRVEKLLELSIYFINLRRSV